MTNSSNPAQEKIRAEQDALRRNGGGEEHPMVRTPTISRAGSYFRTLSFSQEGISNFAIHQEAIEHPTTNKWLIQEVWLRPNLLSPEPPLVEEYQHLKDHSGRQLQLTLADAIAHLATFEHASRRTGLQPVGKTADEMGHTHVETFAGMNGFALDVTNRPHATLHGRIVTKGFFAPETRVKVMDLYSRQSIAPEVTAGNELSRIFRTSATIGNLERVINAKVSLAQWGNFAKAVTDVISQICHVQGKDYEEGERNSIGGLVKVAVIKGENEYLEKSKKARKILSELPFVSETDKKDKFERMLDELHLVYQVGYVKSIYNKLSTSDDPEKHAPELRAKVTECAKFILSTLKGTEEDVRRMEGEIINSPHKCRLTREQTEVLSEYGVETYRNFIFMPDQVFDALAALKSTKEEMQNIIDTEAQRITAPAASEQKQGSTPEKPPSPRRV